MTVTVDTKRQVLTRMLLAMKNTITNEDTKKGILNIIDTVSHTAPELMDSRWMRVYRFCRYHMHELDNEEHTKCFELYEKHFEEYKKLL